MWVFILRSFKKTVNFFTYVQSKVQLIKDKKFSIKPLSGYYMYKYISINSIQYIVKVANVETGNSLKNKMQHYSFFFQYGTLGFFGPAKQASTESIAKYIFDDDPQSKHDLKYIKQKLNKKITISKAKQPFSSFASNRAVFDFVRFSPHSFYYFRCCQTYFEHYYLGNFNTYYISGTSSWEF